MQHKPEGPVWYGHVPTLCIYLCGCKHFFLFLAWLQQSSEDIGRSRYLPPCLTSSGNIHSWSKRHWIGLMNQRAIITTHCFHYNFGAFIPSSWQLNKLVRCLLGIFPPLHQLLFIVIETPVKISVSTCRSILAINTWWSLGSSLEGCGRGSQIGVRELVTLQIKYLKFGISEGPGLLLAVNTDKIFIRGKD